MQNNYDVVIVGGGIVGALLALALARASFTVALVEGSPINTSRSPLMSDRTIVLAHSSRLILEAINIWHPLETLATAISEIHVSDKGHFGAARLTAREESLPALGYVLPAGDIVATLHRALHEFSSIHVYSPAKFISFEYLSNIANIQIQTEAGQVNLSCNLLVAADGQYSSVRKFLNIGFTAHDYQQAAILCNIDLKRSHQNIAYERFTAQGPLAMLPILGQRSALVWTVSHQQAERLLSLSLAKIEAELQQNFGYRLGKLTINTMPIRTDLKLVTANRQIAPGVVLLGNAVHTLHPVAGQGLNLALRDMAVLAEELHVARANGKALGNYQTLNNYWHSRKKDQAQIISLTHSLVGCFSNSLLPVVFARNAGMMILDRVHPLKQLLSKRALGFDGKVPRLASGLSLE